MSTEKLATLCSVLGIRFRTVDMDPKNAKAAAAFLRLLPGESSATAAKGEDYLEATSDELYAAYLDAFDFFHLQHSQERKTSYEENLGSEISNEACWEMHLKCAHHLVKIMPMGGLVVLDDTWADIQGEWTGKGRTALPFLLNNGFSMLEIGNKAVMLRRVTVKPTEESAGISD